MTSSSFSFHSMDSDVKQSFAMTSAELRKVCGQLWNLILLLEPKNSLVAFCS